MYWCIPRFPNRSVPFPRHMRESSFNYLVFKVLFMVDGFRIEPIDRVSKQWYDKYINRLRNVTVL
jgi:hypothetical protein